MMELLEQLNTWMSTNHLGDMNGNLFQMYYFWDNLLIMLLPPVLLGFLIREISYMIRHRRYMRKRIYGGKYRDLDPDRA